jgi:hypothetical protein
MVASTAFATRFGGSVCPEIPWSVCPETVGQLAPKRCGLIHHNLQLRDLQLPSERKLLRCDHKTPYYKMISKYFSIDAKDIPIDTTKNYFSDKQNDIGVKGTLVPPENKLFKIVPETPKKAVKKINKS